MVERGLQFQIFKGAIRCGTCRIQLSNQIETWQLVFFPVELQLMKIETCLIKTQLPSLYLRSSRSYISLECYIVIMHDAFIFWQAIRCICSSRLRRNTLDIGSFLFILERQLSEFPSVKPRGRHLPIDYQRRRRTDMPVFLTGYKRIGLRHSSQRSYYM